MYSFVNVSLVDKKMGKHGFESDFLEGFVDCRDRSHFALFVSIHPVGSASVAQFIGDRVDRGFLDRGWINSIGVALIA